MGHMNLSRLIPLSESAHPPPGRFAQRVRNLNLRKTKENPSHAIQKTLERDIYETLNALPVFLPHCTKREGGGEVESLSHISETADWNTRSTPMYWCRRQLAMKSGSANYNSNDAKLSLKNYLLRALTLRRKHLPFQRTSRPKDWWKQNLEISFLRCPPSKCNNHTFKHKSSIGRKIELQKSNVKVKHIQDAGLSSSSAAPRRTLPIQLHVNFLLDPAKREDHRSVLQTGHQDISSEPAWVGSI